MRRASAAQSNGGSKNEPLFDFPARPAPGQDGREPAVGSCRQPCDRIACRKETVTVCGRAGPIIERCGCGNTRPPPRRSASRQCCSNCWVATVNGVTAAPLLLLDRRRSPRVLRHPAGAGRLRRRCRARFRATSSPPGGFASKTRTTGWRSSPSSSSRSSGASWPRGPSGAQPKRRPAASEIERLYQELQAAFDRASEAEAARRNEQLKAALLDALTHNLRTPLTAIKAAVTALIGAEAWHPSRR